QRASPSRSPHTEINGEFRYRSDRGGSYCGDGGHMCPGGYLSAAAEFARHPDLFPVLDRLDRASVAFVMAGPTGVFGKMETKSLR
ncbi:MAG: hypothetical protein P8X43_15690, partial [Maritimibacter sp.]